jgi:hypothetical protein
MTLCERIAIAAELRRVVNHRWRVRELPRNKQEVYIDGPDGAILAVMSDRRVVIRRDALSKSWPAISQPFKGQRWLERLVRFLMKEMTLSEANNYIPKGEVRA